LVKIKGEKRGEMERTLLELIEEYRRKLDETYAIAKNLVDPDILALSQRLDRLLNQYYQEGCLE